jgi:hypothetical protein
MEEEGDKQAKRKEASKQRTLRERCEREEI